MKSINSLASLTTILCVRVQAQVDVCVCLTLSYLPSCPRQFFFQIFIFIFKTLRTIALVSVQSAGKNKICKKEKANYKNRQNN